MTNETTEQRNMTTSPNDIHRTIQLLKKKLVDNEEAIEMTRSSITITTAQLKQLLRVIAPEPDTSGTRQPSSIEVSLRVAELDTRDNEPDEPDESGWIRDESSPSGYSQVFSVMEGWIKDTAEPYGWRRATSPPSGSVKNNSAYGPDAWGWIVDESMPSCHSQVYKLMKGWIADTSAKSGFRKITSPVSGPAKTNSPDEPNLTKGWTIIKNASSYKVKEDMLGQSRYLLSLPKMKEWCLESYRQVGGFNSPIYNDDDNSNEYLPRCRTPDELINEATHYVERVWLTPERYPLPDPLPDTSMIYIAPGATMELLRTKEKGFEIVYDPIDQ